MDDQSIQHTRWNCTYHIVFIPKYRRKILYGGNKRDVGEILKKLCEMKSVNLIEGRACYGVPDEMKAECRKRLSADMLEVLDRFDERIRGRR